MILTVAIVLCSLLSSTQAQTILRNPGKKQDTASVSLGNTFLTFAKNYTQSNNTSGTTIETRSGTFNLELEISAIRPLATQIDLLCDQHGTVSSKSVSGNDTVTRSYSLGCRLTTAKFNVYEKAVIDLLETAQKDSTSYSYYTDSYVDSSYSYPSNPQIDLAQQKALENLMAKANTIEEVMLVYSSWQYVVSNNYLTNPPTSTISVSLNEKYVYEEFPYVSYNNATNDD